MNSKMSLGFQSLALTLTLANACVAATAPPWAGQSHDDHLRTIESRRHPVPTVALDTTAPAMSAFNAAKVVDVTNGNMALTVSFSASDDLSGVSHGYGRAVGPSGQLVVVQFYETFPTKKFSGRMISELLPAMLEPGEYTFEYAWVHDVLHNAGRYEGAALAALGNARFVIKNRKGYDAKPPALVAGKVLTPVMSASGHQKGTLDQPPRLGISLDMLDSGNSAIAGVRWAQIDLCLADQSNCLYLVAEDSAQPGRATLSARLGDALMPDTPVGDYRVRTVYLYDYAGNETTLTSTEFGGTTDFSTYFPTTTITVTP